MNIIEKMNSLSEKYAKSEYKVYSAILKDPTIVRHATITRIADLSNTSISAVLRFCQTLGYNGYKDFHYAMIQYLDTNEANDINPIQSLSDSYGSIIDQMADQLNEKVLVDWAKRIKKAKGVYIFGTFSSGLAAYKLSFDLSDAGIAAYIATDRAHIGHMFNTVKRDDLIIIFSASGHNDAFNGLIDDKTEADITLVTCVSRPRLGKYCKTVFTLPYLSSLSSEVIFMIFIDMFTYYLKDEEAVYE